MYNGNPFLFNPMFLGPGVPMVSGPGGPMVDVNNGVLIGSNYGITGNLYDPNPFVPHPQMGGYGFAAFQSPYDQPSFAAFQSPYDQPGFAAFQSPYDQPGFAAFQSPYDQPGFAAFQSPYGQPGFTAYPCPHGGGRPQLVASFTTSTHLTTKRQATMSPDYESPLPSHQEIIITPRRQPQEAKRTIHEITPTRSQERTVALTSYRAKPDEPSPTAAKPQLPFQRKQRKPAVPPSGLLKLLRLIKPQPSVTRRSVSPIDITPTRSQERTVTPTIYRAKPAEPKPAASKPQIPHPQQQPKPAVPPSEPLEVLRPTNPQLLVTRRSVSPIGITPTRSPERTLALTSYRATPAVPYAASVAATITLQHCVKRGFAIILNYENFNSKSKYRLGSSADRDRLLTQLEKCGFEVHTYDDLTRDATNDIIGQVLKALHKACLSRKSPDFILLAIFSHGGLDKRGRHVISTYDSAFDFKKMRDQFFRPKQDIGDCPKMILLQACWGNNTTPAKYYHDSMAPSNNPTRSNSDAELFPDNWKPAEGEHIVLKAVTEGNVAYRQGKQGSLLVKGFCKGLEKACRSKRTLAKVIQGTRQFVVEAHSKKPNSQELPVVEDDTMMSDVYFASGIEPPSPDQRILKTSFPLASNRNC